MKIQAKAVAYGFRQRRCYRCLHVITYFYHHVCAVKGLRLNCFVCAVALGTEGDITLNGRRYFNTERPEMKVFLWPW